ncbi:hypothetical protein GN244_ATG03922 [Phytophthora infestans]|uniref:Uncharacterized protein n=1 Tax=Phytophthora infestans TaxID=4787 RepID=A0A833WNE0_PHYIN|nr:hypothetical protein GN244_ATG03922 [Phytophthora infestans]KAF4150132.1 hypothetical protein GN958_ATG00758 [Phytophthora infestans]KAI9982964.1 hypothetical protein PInf_006815 [Phytophthora infestans]KAI9983038.1 hypothetical protein PInf_006955 [Phytophthora infestans]
MSSASCKRKADELNTAEICQYLLEQESSRDTTIKELKAEIQRLKAANDHLRQRKLRFDADEALARLSTWVAGDDGLLRGALSGRCALRAARLRMVTLSNQPPKPPAGGEAKMDVQTARTPRKRGSSGYSSAASNGGTDYEMKKDVKIRRQTRRKTA